MKNAFFKLLGILLAADFIVGFLMASGGGFESQLAWLYAILILYASGPIGAILLLLSLFMYIFEKPAVKYKAMLKYALVCLVNTFLGIFPFLLGAIIMQRLLGKAI